MEKQLCKPEGKLTCSNGKVSHALKQVHKIEIVEAWSYIMKAFKLKGFWYTMMILILKTMTLTHYKLTKNNLFQKIEE